MSATMLCTLYRLGMGEAGVLAQAHMTEAQRRERVARLRRAGVHDVLWVPPSSLKVLLRSHDEKI